MNLMGIAREACIADPLLLWVIILGNLGVLLAYLWIPLSVVRVLNSQDMLPQPMLWMLAAMFILSCGITHAVGVLVIFKPYYGLESGMLIITALVSLTAGAALHRAVPLIRIEVKEYAALKERVRTLLIDLDKERSCREEIEIRAQAAPLAAPASSAAAAAPPASGPLTPDSSPDAAVP